VSGIAPPDRKAHGQHVVGRRQPAGQFAIAEERQVARVHVGVGDQRAEGVQPGRPLRHLGPHQALVREALHHVGPGLVAPPEELVVEATERKHGAPPAFTDAVEALDLEETLVAQVDDGGARCGHAGFTQGFEGQVLGQQQVAPALGNGVLRGHAELHEHVPWAIGRFSAGGELGLFPAGGRAGHVTP
jgi:hypothetical protein